MNGKLLWLLAGSFLIAGLSGCSKETPLQTGLTEKTITPAQSSGGFGISYMKGLARARQAAKAQSGDNVKFNLGSIRGSTAFYFLLYNVGSTPITNVTLSVADTNFSLYPMKIDTLVPGSDVGILPIVKVNAFHGTSLDGIGNRPLLKMGLNDARLTVQGATKTKAGADTTVSLSVGLQVNALVMDFKLYGRSGVINLSNSSISMGKFSLPDSTVAGPTSWRSYVPVNLNFMNGQKPSCYSNDIRDSVMMIVNIGNVALNVRQYVSGPAFNVDASVAPGDSVVVHNAGGNYIVDGNHAVANPDKITLHTDGKCYFVFDFNPYAPTCGTYFDADLFKRMMEKATCAELENSVSMLKNNLVFWERRGNCPGDSFAYTLFHFSPDSIVALYKDSPTGPKESYASQEYKDLLTKIRDNIANNRDIYTGIGEYTP